MRNYKKVSSNGSINIPVAIRREMGIQGKDPMEVSMKDGVIVITPYTPRCAFCGSVDQVLKFEGKHICKSCGSRLFDVMKGGAE